MTLLLLAISFVGFWGQILTSATSHYLAIFRWWTICKCEYVWLCAWVEPYIHIYIYIYIYIYINLDLQPFFVLCCCSLHTVSILVTSVVAMIHQRTSFRNQSSIKKFWVTMSPYSTATSYKFCYLCPVPCIKLIQYHCFVLSTAMCRLKIFLD